MRVHARPHEPGRGGRRLHGVEMASTITAMAHAEKHTVDGDRDVRAFEREYAAYVGTERCVGVGSGTEALELALRAVGVGPGAEVILPANTVVATAEVVARIGAEPVLVDVDSQHLLLDTDAAQAAVTPRTRAIVPVHLHGQMAFVERLTRVAEDFEVAIVEDAAQAQGADRHGWRAGSLGTVSVTGFDPGMNLDAAGHAGAVLTDDHRLADRVRVLGRHGSPRKGRLTAAGRTSGLGTDLAVDLRARLRCVDRRNDDRRAAAERYHGLLGDLAARGLVQLPSEAPGNHHVWNRYTVQVDRRDEVLGRLRRAGVGARAVDAVPIHLTGAFGHLGLGRGSFRVSEDAADRLLALPMVPDLTVAQQERVAQVLTDALRGPGGGLAGATVSPRT